MDSSIPSDAEIADAARHVIRLRRRVESQRELYELVLGELSADGSEVHVTPSRVRRVAVTSGAASVEIDYRDKVKAGLPDICPVCKGGMNPVYSINLDGRKVELRRNCSVCSFTAAGKTRVPARYAFVKPASGAAESADRIRMLNKAAAYVRMAEKLVTEAAEGTDLISRAEHTVEMLDEVLASKQDPSSLKNLKADLKDDSGPLWTRPLDSPKKARGKDI